MTPEQLKALTDAIRAEVEKGASQNREALEKMLADHKLEVEKNLAKQQDIVKSFAVPGSGDATHKGQKFSFAKFNKAVFTGDWRDAQFERAISDEATTKVKAMNVVPDSTGGFAVPTEVMVDQIIPLLYAKSVCAQLGATQLTGLTAIPVAIPKLTGGSTAYWLNEGGAITASDLTFGQVRLTPRILATVSVWSELLNMAQPAIETMTKNDQATKMALKIDLAALTGTGGSEPLGLVNWPGVSTEATAASSPTYDLLTNMVDDVEGANALDGNLGWALSTSVKKLIRQAKDATGGTDNKINYQPLGNRELWNEQAKTILGYKQAATTQLGTHLIFGNWADLILAQWGGMMVAASSEVGFLNGQRHLRTMTFVDSVIRHGESFSVSTS